MTRIGVIIGSTRPERVGEVVGRWVVNQARSRGVNDIDFIDLAEVDLPFMDEPSPAATGIYIHEHTRRWARRVAALDAVILVTAEYNGSIPAPLKNALDFLGPQWADLPVVIVAYGNTSSGSRAATALLPVLSGLAMLHAGSLMIGLRDRQAGTGLAFTSDDHEALSALIDRLLWLANTLPARSVDYRQESGPRAADTPLVALSAGTPVRGR